MDLNHGGERPGKGDSAELGLLPALGQFKRDRFPLPPFLCPSQGGWTRALRHSLQVEPENPHVFERI